MQYVFRVDRLCLIGPGLCIKGIAAYRRDAAQSILAMENAMADMSGQIVLQTRGMLLEAFIAVDRIG